MFSQFENFFKKGEGLNVFQTKDYSKTPQKFNINGRQIQQKKLLAEGAFGFIWLAEDINSKEEFALKRVISSTQDRRATAIKEKQIMEKLPESPHIVKYYGGSVFNHQGKTVIVTLMELCPNGTLFDYLQKMEGKGINESTLKTIASSILKGLKVMHNVGIAHRDIKIQNVLIGKDKKMKLCDFGSCSSEVIDFKQIPKQNYDLVREEIQSYTTPMYRPPEIVDPYLQYKVNTKVDQWMLGCVLYTMAYFTHPFVESNAVGIAAAVFRFPEHPSETQYLVSEKVKDLIRNLLTPNPQFRPSSDKMLEIVEKWDMLDAIPLNSEAKKIKKEHEQKEKELKKLNKKVVDIDGDIPMEELMKIQQKIKSKETEEVKSFVNQESKANKVSKKVPSQSMQPVQKKQTKPQPKKSTIDQLWGSNFGQQTKSKPNNDFDAFNDFFKQPQKKSQPVKNTNFQQFFTEGPKMQESKKKEFNLLDL